MKHLNLKSYLVTGVCLALAVMSVACSDDDKKKLPGEGDGVRKRTFESADYASGWKYFSFIEIHMLYSFIYRGRRCKICCNRIYNIQRSLRS